MAPVPVRSQGCGASRYCNPANRPTGVIRTALCVEPRGGALHIFMPPVETSEDYLALIAGIEATAAELALPVVIEGETPPFDPRLAVIKLTPRSRCPGSQHPPGAQLGRAGA